MSAPAPSMYSDAAKAVAQRLAAFGWLVEELDGHDHAELETALRRRSTRPRAIVARTVKGAGVDFMEDELMWHYRPLKGADRERALAQLPARPTRREAA
jgi:transketolase